MSFWMTIILWSCVVVVGIALIIVIVNTVFDKDEKKKKTNDSKQDTNFLELEERKKALVYNEKIENMFFVVDEYYEKEELKKFLKKIGEEYKELKYYDSFRLFYPSGEFETRIALCINKEKGPAIIQAYDKYIEIVQERKRKELEKNIDKILKKALEAKDD